MSENPTFQMDKISHLVGDASSSLNDAASKLQQAEAHLKELSLHVNTSLAVSYEQEAFFFLLTVFVLACFIGYYVIWEVAPSLHSPLKAMTNTISSVIIVGAIIAAGPETFSEAKVLGFFAVLFASINIFGGIHITGRMLSMFKKKSQKG